MHGWYSEEHGVSDLTRTIDGLHFHDSVLVVEKRAHDHPVVRMTGRDRDELDGQGGPDASG